MVLIRWTIYQIISCPSNTVKFDDLETRPNSHTKLSPQSLPRVFVDCFFLQCYKPDCSPYNCRCCWALSTAMFQAQHITEIST